MLAMILRLLFFFFVFWFVKRAIGNFLALKKLQQVSRKSSKRGSKNSSEAIEAEYRVVDS